MSSSLNSVDIFVIFIFAISILLGFLRGFLREVISLITWIAASAISTLFASKLAGVFTGGAGGSMSSAVQGASQGNYTHFVALGISFVVLFIGTLFAGYIVNIIVIGILQGAFISLPNRLLGALFGAIRGFIFVVILMFIAELTPMSSQPAWAQSKSVKLFEPTVKWLQDKVQPGLDLIKEKAQGAMEGIKNAAPGTSGFQNMLGSPGGGGDTSPYSSSGGQ